jgi:type IV pilus assembly protein PilQ
MLSSKFEIYREWCIGVNVVKRFSGLFLSLLFMGMSSEIMASGAIITGVDASAMANGLVELRVEFDGNVPENIGSFTIDNPARLAIDIPQSSLSIEKRIIPIEIGVASSVRLLQAGDRSRIVINLTQMVPYNIRTTNNTIFVQLNTERDSQRVSTDKRTIGAATDKLSVTEIKSIDFRRGESGEARIIVELSDSSSVVDLQKINGKILIDFIGASLPQELKKRLDVIDFATPVSLIDAFTSDRGAQLVITPGEKEYDYMAYQTGNTYQVEVKPLTEEEAKEIKKDKLGYSGEKLSLNFQNIEVRSVLQLIADFTGLNIVASDTVNGAITLRLKNVPWDQALDIILRTRGLGKRQTGNVMLVAPNTEIAEREKQELEAQMQIVDLAPVVTRFYQINYAKASDISTLLKSGEKSSMLSARGQVTVDQRTNTLMILDTSEKLDEIGALVRKLDVPIRQVMIESRIVTANNDFSRSLGVTANLGPNPANTAGISTNGANGTMNINLPSSPANGQFGLAVLGSNYLIDLELSAMQTEGVGELVSNPRVITSNQKEATIEQGVEIPYQEASSSGATSVSFKKAVLSLKVTPQITPDDRIVMDLEVSKDNVSSVVSGGVPAIDTRAISTQVLVNNGETVVLGGIYEQEKVNTQDAVPGLSSIPLLGYLFRRDSKFDNKKELLIFVTPKILKDSLKAGF